MEKQELVERYIELMGAREAIAAHTRETMEEWAENTGRCPDYSLSDSITKEKIRQIENIFFDLIPEETLEILIEFLAKEKIREYRKEIEPIAEKRRRAAYESLDREMIRRFTGYFPEGHKTNEMLDQQMKSNLSYSLGRIWLLIRRFIVKTLIRKSK